MDLTRRDMLRLSGVAAAAGITSPLWVRLGALAAQQDASVTPVPGDRKLLVVLLEGGNDGLNTVVPYASGDYYAKRPTLAIPAARVLRLPDSSRVGLHPSLAHLYALYLQHQVAIVQGVGYDQPDLSHFGSMDIWQTASPDHALNSGWLGRYLDATPGDQSVIRAASIGPSVPPALLGGSASVAALTSFGSFRFTDGSDANPASEAYRLHKAFVSAASPGQSSGDPVADAFMISERVAVVAVRSVDSLGNTKQPAPSNLADQVAMAMTLLSSNLGVRIAFVSLSSFDDHSAESGNHDSLLAELDRAIGRFADLAAASGRGGDYLLFTFSEFGRRVQENGSGGSDHGAAAPLFVVGPSVAGGLYGAQPRLDSAGLDTNGNPVRRVDFRDAYATLIDGWLGGANSAQVLGSPRQPIRFLQ